VPRLKTVVRITLALCAGAVIGALLVPAVFTFNAPHGWSMWDARGYLAYSVVALLFTLPTGLVAGAVAYGLLAFIPQRMHMLFFAAAGVVAAVVVCVITSPMESIGHFMAIGAVSAVVAFALLPRSNPVVERDARQERPRAPHYERYSA